MRVNEDGTSDIISCTWLVVCVLPDALCTDDCAPFLGFRGKTRFANVAANTNNGVANSYECHRVARHVLDMAMDGIEPDTS